MPSVRLALIVLIAAVIVSAAPEGLVVSDDAAAATSPPAEPSATTAIEPPPPPLTTAGNTATADPATTSSPDATSAGVAEKVTTEAIVTTAPMPKVGAERLVFTDVDVNCDGVRDWLQEELTVGEKEAFDLNNEAPLPQMLEAKVRVAPRSATFTEFKLLCITYTYDKANPKAAVLHDTWGRNCTRHIIITNKWPEDIAGVDKADVFVMEPPGGEHGENLWQKTMAIFQTLVQRPDTADYDYFFMGGDDVMMLPPNLQKVFNEPGVKQLHLQGTPLFLGTRFVSPIGDKVLIDQASHARAAGTLDFHGLQQEFLSGAGYAMNTAAMHLAAVAFKNKHGGCNPGMRSHAEDLYLAVCLEDAFGIGPRDVRDPQGEDRIMAMSPGHMHPQAVDAGYSWWYRDFKPIQYPVGGDIVSRHNIVWHYVTPDDVRKMTKQYLGF
jgi:hypothetical protein